ncbi:MAG: cytochrome C oxidase subunit IV family protein [Bacteroidia bacterium]|nr:cytochrome C oxidase subunit IV family protein [Bacteroidia bacterium]
MSDFHDHYPQYEVMSNHGEEEGKKARRTLWNVFWIMLAITVAELSIGFMAPDKGWSGTLGLKILFITLTVAKAAFIVIWFMHLGHEVKLFKYTILVPYIVFMFYTIFIVLTEGVYSGKQGNLTRVDPIFIQQQEDLKKGHHGAEAGGESHEAAAEEAHH